MARRRFSLAELQRTDLSTLSRADLRSAYTAYRDVMQKRVARLAEGTEAQQKYARPFQAGGSKELLSLREIDKFRRQGWTEDQLRREMLMRVKELQILEKSERLNITGWKKIEQRTIDSLHRAGYQNINKGNIKNFGKFMERMREAFGNKIFPSDEAAELFDTTKGEAADLPESELLGIIEDLGGITDGVDLFA